MCITFFYISENPNQDKYKLVLIMNRDEFFKRPTSRCDWKDGILAGRDQVPGKEGGTWLAINDKGHIGILTNIYTGIAKPGKGRGFLITDYLKKDNTDDEASDNLEEYLKHLALSKVLYSPFNIVFFKPEKDIYKAHYYCRGFQGCFVKDSIGPEQIEPGFHGLSNHPKKTPYQKTEAGIEKFRNVLETYQDNENKLIEELFKMMKNCTSYYPDEQMINQGGIDSPIKPYHDKLACINVQIPEMGYGTRVSTLIFVDRDNNVTCVERAHQNNEEDKLFQFKI